LLNGRLELLDTVQKFLNLRVHGVSPWATVANDIGTQPVRTFLNELLFFKCAGTAARPP
jgi:hypothetical protein